MNIKSHGRLRSPIREAMSYRGRNDNHVPSRQDRTFIANFGQSIPLCDRRRICAASRMKFGFRTISVVACSFEGFRSNKERQSINRRPRQLTSSCRRQCRPDRAQNSRNKLALMLGLRLCSQSKIPAFLSSFLIGRGKRSRMEFAYWPRFE